MAAMAIPAASVISSVRTTREEGMLSVILEGDGRLSAKNVELAAGNRLYLDFDGVRPAVPAVTPFGQAPVQRVRVALTVTSRSSPARSSTSTAKWPTGLKPSGPTHAPSR